jgi:hypothetical protein
VRWHLQARNWSAGDIEPEGSGVSMLCMIPGPVGFYVRWFLGLEFRGTHDMMPLISASFRSVIETGILIVALGSIFVSINV